MTIFYCLRFDTPQPGGPGPSIYIPLEKCGPVIPLETGFPFRRLLRLAVLRWRYSTPQPHGIEEVLRKTNSLLYIRYILVLDTTRTAQKTSRPIVILLLRPLPRELYYRANAKRRPSLLAPLFRLCWEVGVTHTQTARWSHKLTFQSK
jgi:hypothetical protein